jgi:hypothetical protein
VFLKVETHCQTPSSTSYFNQLLFIFNASVKIANNLIFSVKLTYDMTIHLVSHILFVSFVS